MRFKSGDRVNHDPYGDGTVQMVLPSGSVRVLMDGDGGVWTVDPRVLTAAPAATLSAEDVGVLLNTERAAIADKAWEWSRNYVPGSDGRNTFVLFYEWVRARAAAQPQEAAMDKKPKFKVFDRVRVIEQGLIRTGDTGKIVEFFSDGWTAVVAFDNGATGEFAVQHLEPATPTPTPAPKPAPPPTDRERAIAAARDAVVEAALVWRDAAVAYRKTPSGRTDATEARAYKDLAEVTDALRSLLTPPADPIAELREAAEEMEKALVGSVDEVGLGDYAGPSEFAMVEDARNRLRAALRRIQATAEFPGVDPAELLEQIREIAGAQLAAATVGECGG